MALAKHYNQFDAFYYKIIEDINDFIINGHSVARIIQSLATVAKQHIICFGTGAEINQYTMMHHCTKFHAFITF